MQQTQYSPHEFNELIRLAFLNDDEFGILSNIYDNEHPHPHFNPDNLGFYRYRNYNHSAYTVRSDLDDKSYVFEDFEMYWPGDGDENHGLRYQTKNQPLTDKDYMITACITDQDHRWPVPYCYNNYHFVRTHEVNKQQVFEQPDTRHFFADVLLGNPKTHRNIFFKMLRAHRMLDDCIINLFGVYKSQFLNDVHNDAQKVIDEAGRAGGYINTTNQLESNFVSQYISKPIMQNSWISVVGETIANNNCFFVTEKTAKPLMAGRPFIMLGGQHYLKRLRSLGFSTFNPVIDESYDEIADEKERMVAAFKSFKALKELDQQEVRKQLGDVLEHNQKIMFSKQAITQRARDFLDNIRLDHI